MDIQRINDYCDPRFRDVILRQHGAFLADGRPWGFEITGPDSAVVSCAAGCNEAAPPELIDEFRFYAEHITRFYDESGALIREFPPVSLFPVPLARIQPSQFFVDETKLQAVGSFVRSSGDIVVPLLQDGDRYISLDGHTRLFLALERGYPSVYGFLSESGGYIRDFVDEARRRGIYGVKDIQKLSHERYVVQWDRFCENFFREREPS